MKSLEMSPIFSFTSNCSQPKELASIGFIILVSSLISGCLNSIILVVNIPLIFANLSFFSYQVPDNNVNEIFISLFSIWVVTSNIWFLFVISYDPVKN